MIDNRKKAEALAARPYVLVIARESAIDGDGYVYVAMNTEIEGCKAQGLTMAEAKENLNDVRVDLIEHLLNHNLPIPSPSAIEQTTTASSSQEISGDLRQLPTPKVHTFGASLKTPA